MSRITEGATVPEKWSPDGRSQVRETIEKLLEEIDCVLYSPKPNIEDVRTLFAIRKQLANRGLTSSSFHESQFLLSPDEMVDVIGKQLGVK
jgi:hypothetical protein